MASELLRVGNLTRGTTLATRARRANSFWTRLRGLLGTRELPPESGLVLEPCASVHMFGMQYALDVVFADSLGRVLGAERELKPWRMSSMYRGAHFAIELPVGVIASSGTEVGDRLGLEPA